MMSNYQAGKDFRELELRISKLEEALQVNLNCPSCSKAPLSREHGTSDTVIQSTIDFFHPDGMSIIPMDAGYPPVEKLQSIITGGGQRWNTGFPDWRNYSIYGGTLWLQHIDTGEKIIFDHIETGSADSCDIVFGDKSRWYHEGRNTYICDYGGTGALNGTKAFSSWARFSFSDGFGYSITKFTAFC